MCRTPLLPGQELGEYVEDGGGLEVERNLCSVDVAHFFSSNWRCYLVERTKDTDRSRLIFTESKFHTYLVMNI